MEQKRISNRGRLGAIRPAKTTLVKALSGIREKNYQAAGEKGRYVLTAREMVVLGRLISSWKEVVGLQLAHKTCPFRLIKGKLYLTVADSQWLQTLVFLKDRIITKLAELFPDIKISDIIGRAGRIPEDAEKIVKDAEWPDWKNESIPEFQTEIVDADLLVQMQRCRKKLQARLKGLEQRGMSLCPACRAVAISSEKQKCAQCEFNERNESRKQIRHMLFEMPWLTFEELREFDSQINSGEYLGLKIELLDECLGSIREKAAELSVDFSEEDFKMMKKEMARALMLHTGRLPYQIDIFNISEKEMPDPMWHKYLSLDQGEPEC